MYVKTFFGTILSFTILYQMEIFYHLQRHPRTILSVIPENPLGNILYDNIYRKNILFLFYAKVFGMQI